MYSLIKPFFFRSDPEKIHERVMAWLEWTGRHRAALNVVSSLCQVHDDRLAAKHFGLTFPNPIGLAAGFDKNALAVPAWSALGFGSVEIGSVTALAQAGNEKPRLFRLPADEALINRMGFNNDGAEVIATRLRHLRETQNLSAPLGINLGKSKVTALDHAPQDYLSSMKKLWDYADYFVINVSSPNTPGLRALQDKDKLEELLSTLTNYANAQKNALPILLKIAPDLTWQHIDEILELVFAHKLAGLIATNTTISREGLQTTIDEAGGLSGKPLKARALEVLYYLRKQVGNKLPLISVGGIATVDDVYERLNAGASLLQLYSSFIYQGPMLLRRLNQGLLKKLEQDGLKSLEELKVR